MRKIIIAIKLPLNVTSFKIKVLFARFKYARTHLQLKAYAECDLQICPCSSSSWSWCWRWSWSRNWSWSWRRSSWELQLWLQHNFQFDILRDLMKSAKDRERDRERERENRKRERERETGGSRGSCTLGPPDSLGTVKRFWRRWRQINLASSQLIGQTMERIRGDGEGEGDRCLQPVAESFGVLALSAYVLS